jgi:hypothetical protein
VFNDAVRMIENICGFKLTKDQIGQLHRHITKQDYTFEQIIEDGVNLFCPQNWVTPQG